MRFKDTEYTGGHVLGETPEFPIVIEENFTFYNVDLNDGLMTGIFLDQKEVRKKLRDYFAENRSILNLFSYTGAFSVVASKNAKVTTSVDLANRSRTLTEENFGLNGALDVLAPDGTLLLCTNSSAFSLKAFKNVIKKTLEQANVEYEIEEVMGLPKDFKTHPHYKPSKYLKAVFINIKH